LEGVSTGSDTVGALVIRSIKGAILCTVRISSTNCLVPFIAGVAVGITVSN
jgi:hypothetical protein